MVTIHFPGQYPDEEIILIRRRHPIVLLSHIIFMILMIFVPFIVYFSLSSFFGVKISGVLWQLFLFLTGLYYFLVCAIIFRIIIDYYLDVWIVSNQRLIAIEQKGLFNRVITEVRYNRIQDITSQVLGFIPTFFRFGNISIQTAAEQERMVFKQIPHPIETRQVIAEAYRKALEQQSQEAAL